MPFVNFAIKRTGIYTLRTYFKMKRIFLFTAVFSLFSALSMLADDEITIDGVLYMIPASNPETVSVMGCDDLVGQDKTVTILSSVVIDGQSYPVKAIGRRAFQNCNLTGIRLPSTIVSIGQEAFCNSALETIDIPDEVTYIGPAAFADCPALRSVKGGRYTAVPDRMCENSPLTDLMIPDTVTEIGDNACKNSGIKKIVIPEETVRIGDGAFKDCTGLEEIDLRSSKLKRVGKDAFIGCSKLRKIKKAKGVTTDIKLI